MECKGIKQDAVGRSNTEKRERQRESPIKVLNTTTSSSARSVHTSLSATRNTHTQRPHEIIVPRRMMMRCDAHQHHHRYRHHDHRHLARRGKQKKNKIGSIFLCVQQSAKNKSRGIITANPEKQAAHTKRAPFAQGRCTALGPSVSPIAPLRVVKSSGSLMPQPIGGRE